MVSTVQDCEDARSSRGVHGCGVSGLARETEESRCVAAPGGEEEAMLLQPTLRGGVNGNAGNCVRKEAC